MIALAASQAAAQESLWLTLDRPGHDEHVRLVAPLVEVRGRTVVAVTDGAERLPPGDARGVELVSADVVLALDLSNTALHAMGLDVDGDGKVGKDRRRWYPGMSERPYRFWTSDPGDTIVRAELLAAGSIVERLADRSVRIGVLTYTSEPRELAEVGTPEAALEGLERIRIEVDWSGTDISRALQRADEMLDLAPRKRGPARPRIVLLFSDGDPTVPHNQWLAKREAVKVARELAQEGVQIYALGFGEDVREEPGVLGELAELTGGRYIPVLEPANVLRDLASIEFAKPGGLTMTNLTTGESGRAIRVFSDGSFDGFLGLAAGANLLEVAADGPDGERVREQRLVFYEKPSEQTLEDRRRAARMLVELRHRFAETELASLADGALAAPLKEPGEGEGGVEGTLEVRPDRQLQREGPAPDVD